MKVQPADVAPGRRGPNLGLEIFLNTSFIFEWGLGRNEREI